MRNRNQLNRAVGAKAQMFGARHAVVAVGFAKRSAMVADDPFVVAVWEL